MIDLPEPKLSYYGVPSAGLQPRALAGDESLLRDLVIRSRIEYFAAECAAGEKAMNPNYMSSHYRMTMTSWNSKPAVTLRDLMAEVESRAAKGSALASRFLTAARKFQKTDTRHKSLQWPQWTKNEELITAVIHDLVNTAVSSTDFLRKLNSHHTAQNFGGIAEPKAVIRMRHGAKEMAKRAGNTRSKPLRKVRPAAARAKPSRRRALTPR